MKNDIRRLVHYYVKKFDTTDPFKIAKALDVKVKIGKLGFEGCYMFLKNHRCIFLNEDLSERDRMLVMAHELGHALMHRKENCYFIRNQTLLLNSKKEVEANTFAMELLISDDFIEEHRYRSTEQLSRLAGYSESLIQLRVK